jgi:hypothetical protein
MPIDCNCERCGAPFRVKPSHAARGGGRFCSILCRNRTMVRPKHGHVSGGRQSRTYQSWASMKDRCTRPANPKFEHYGGRGIGFCARWHDFAQFLADMGERPAGTSLDRIDVNGNYEPGNCRWATREQQTYNTRQTHWVEYGGQKRCLTELARELGLDPAALHARIKRGWPEWRWAQPSDKRIQIRRTNLCL